MPEAFFNSSVILNNGRYDFLIDHAIRNIWCNPEQDNQHILAPRRISHPEGVLNYSNIMMRSIEMPTKHDIYHVFQVGQMHPLLIGLFHPEPNWVNERWKSVAGSINSRKMLVDVYTDTGIQIPKFQVFYMFNNDRDLLIAVKQEKKLPINYSTEQIYIRVYSNAYFNSIRSNSAIQGTYCYGAIATSTSQILDIQKLFEEYQTKRGLTYCFVNGYQVNKLDLLTIQIGDIVEFIYDSSVIRSVTFTVGNLPTFNSDLDSVRKYLLHYAHQDNVTIDYHDDMDIYVLDELPNGQYNGVYYHRNAQDACRMVTHRDYSIVLPYFVNLANKLQTKAGSRILDFNQLKIRINIRNSGYERPLVFENNRIQELYKMNSNDIYQVMVGVNALVSVWTAANLEKSGYTEIMRSRATNINTDMIQRGLGYNAISKLLADTPKRTYEYSGNTQVSVPHGLAYNSTAYEYDENGILLGYYIHNAGTVYNARNPLARLVEMFTGIGDYTPDVRFGTNNIPVPTADGYRVYRCYKNGIGNIITPWEDVTGTNFYTIVNNKIIWIPTDYNAYVMVRTDAKFLAYDLNMFPVGGTLRFTFSEMENRIGHFENFEMPVPMGELTLILNGKTLIEGLDYNVRFPEVVINNKKFLKHPLNTTPQNIHVRFTGFCKSDKTRDGTRDIGWVKYGLLSENNRYDLRDDRVMSIVINGKLKHRDDLLFSEVNNGITVPDSRNGQPYQIKDIVVPMKNNVAIDTYAYRELSKVIDDSVSNYLTTKLPDPPESGPSSIPSRYELVSPFIAKILYDVIVEAIAMTTLERTLSDNDILAICQPYEHWLQYDPTQPECAVDDSYVIIHPHIDYNAIQLNLQQYHFVRRVVKLYCNDLVELSPFIILES